MSTCGMIARVLVMAFFALNAYNEFSHATTHAQQFKADYTAVVATVKSKFGLSLPAQLQPGFVNNYAYEIIYYGSIAKMVLSVLGVFCGWSGILAGLMYFKCQFIHLNYLNANFTNPADLEKLLQPIALFIAALAVSCCGSCSKKCDIRGDQAHLKKRH